MSVVIPRRKESEIIDILFSNRKIDQLHEYLQQNPDLDILSLADNQDNTILHQLAYEGHLDIIRLFVKEIRQRLIRKLSSPKKQLYQKDHDQEIKNWMNRQNNEGFTALLYASYSGHLDVIQYLVQEHQVNYQLTTKSGLNPFHLAAQKNMLVPLIYFRGRMDINSRDQLNSTSLHWAAYTNSEEVTSFLLADPNLNCLDHRDNEGNTALMLAVLYGNTRVVRRLLIKGADRYIGNNQNKTPLQVARQNKFKTISRMLNQEFSCVDMLKLYCNVKIEYRPTDRKLTYPLVFLVTFVLNAAILNTLITFSEWYPLYSQVIVFTTMILLYLTLLTAAPQREAKDYDELVRQKSEKTLKKMCFQCRNFIPRRGYHCDICKVCIHQYDHHCTWINNCVGKRNIGRFNFFLFFLILSLAFIGIFSILAQICICSDSPILYLDWFQLRFNPVNTLERVCLGLLFGITILTSLFIFPILLLFLYQVKNLLTNKTTFELLRKPPSESGEIKQKMRKYNSKLSLRNCKMMCSDSKSSASQYNTTTEESNQIFSSMKPSHEHLQKS